MSWIRLPNGKIIYKTNQFEGQLKNEFAKLKGWSLTETAEKFCIQGAMTKKEDREFYSFQVLEIQKHFDCKDRIAEELNENFFAYNNAKNEIKDWLNSFCSSHNNVFIGTTITQGQKNIITRLDSDLGVSYKSFYLFQTKDIKGLVDSTSVITGAYNIEIDRLLAIVGTLDNFYIVFTNGLAYGVCTIEEKGKEIVQIEIVSHSQIEERILKIIRERDQKKYYEYNLPKVEISFEKLKQAIEKEVIDGDDYLAYSSNTDGSIDFYVSTEYGKHNLFTLTSDNIFKNRDEISALGIRLMSHLIEITNKPKEND